MANKAGNSKSSWSDTRKKSQSAASVARNKRKAERLAKNKAQAAHNKAQAGLLTPWEQAKEARRKRREGLSPQPRTNCGNILIKGADGIQRVRPGTKREVEMALQIRQAEAQREAEGQKQRKAKTKKAS